MNLTAEIYRRLIERLKKRRASEGSQNPEFQYGQHQKSGQDHFKEASRYWRRNIDLKDFRVFYDRSGGGYILSHPRFGIVAAVTVTLATNYNVGLRFHRDHDWRLRQIVGIFIKESEYVYFEFIPNGVHRQ